MLRIPVQLQSSCQWRSAFRELGGWSGLSVQVQHSLHLLSRGKSDMLQGRVPRSVGRSTLLTAGGARVRNVLRSLHLARLVVRLLLRRTLSYRSWLPYVVCQRGLVEWGPSALHQPLHRHMGAQKEPLLTEILVRFCLMFSLFMPTIHPLRVAGSLSSLRVLLNQTS